MVKICLYYREMTLSKLDKKAQVTQTQLLNVFDFIMLSEGKYYIQGYYRENEIFPNNPNFYGDTPNYMSKVNLEYVSSKF